MPDNNIFYRQLALKIKHWGHQLGFQQTGITDTDLSVAEQHLQNWLDKGYHGTMDYMQKHGSKRSRPAELEPNTQRVISVRLNFLPEQQGNIKAAMSDSARALVSRYALGRDYHKLMRKRLQKLAKQIAEEVDDLQYRVFVDSAPVLEKPLAAKAGLGWIGKHSNLINRDAGSWFFLGEIYTNIPLPIDQPISDHCGKCTDCISVCPTQAIVKPYVVDGSRCISFLTIEHKGAIPIELRPLMGNHIYGCDDCFVVCPWNRFAQLTSEQDFLPRQHLDTATLLELFSWDEKAFLQKTEGSAIRRTGHQGWQRNIAIALGNGKTDKEVLQQLANARESASDMVKEHIDWAIQQLKSS